MSLIDHLMMFDSEVAAFAALPQHSSTDPDTQTISWNASYAMPVQVFIPDGNGGETPIAKTFVWLALPALDESLRDMPGNACRLIADRDAADAGKPFLLYRAPDLTDDVFSAARVEPVFAGTKYPFGSA